MVDKETVKIESIEGFTSSSSGNVVDEEAIKGESIEGFTSSSS